MIITLEEKLEKLSNAELEMIQDLTEIMKKILVRQDIMAEQIRKINELLFERE